MHMKRKLTTALFLILLCMFSFTACKDKKTENEPTSEVITSEEATNSAENPSSEASSEGESTEEVTTEAPKENTQTAKGVFNGFCDNFSVEITLSSGETKTFITFTDEIKAALEQIPEGSTIEFEYGPLEGQGNDQIIAIIKK